jgi:hypothetical protein
MIEYPFELINLVASEGGSTGPPAPTYTMVDPTQVEITFAAAVEGGGYSELRYALQPGAWADDPAVVAALDTDAGGIRTEIVMIDGQLPVEIMLTASHPEGGYSSAINDHPPGSFSYRSLVGDSEHSWDLGGGQRWYYDFEPMTNALFVDRSQILEPFPHTYGHVRRSNPSLPPGWVGTCRFRVYAWTDDLEPIEVPYPGILGAPDGVRRHFT